MTTRNSAERHPDAEPRDLLSAYVDGLSTLCFFFWALTALLLGLYGLGNFQNFLDETLLLLLRGARVTAPLSLLFAVWFQLGLVLKAVLGRGGFVLGTLTAVFLGFGAAAASLLVGFLLVLFLPGA